MTEDGPLLPVTVRVPSFLHRQIQEQARRLDLTMNAYMTLVLAEAAAAQEKHDAGQAVR